MKSGRWGRLASPSMWWAIALSMVAIVGTVTVRAKLGSSNTDALIQYERFAAALADSLCTSLGIKSKFQREMDTGMGRMMTDMHAPGYSGNVDVDFLAMMVPHHQGAVDMARLVLVYGRDPATRMLAEDIIAGQTIEIQSMQRRLIALQQPNAVVAENEFPALGGTRGP